MESKSRLTVDTQRGTTLLEYALTVIIIAIIAIASLRFVGMEIRDSLIAGGGTISTMNNDDEGKANLPL